MPVAYVPKALIAAGSRLASERLERLLHTLLLLAGAYVCLQSAAVLLSPSHQFAIAHLPTHAPELGKQALNSTLTGSLGPQDGAHSSPEAIKQQHGLFVGVLSAAGNAEVRQAIRETWGSDKRLTRVMFFLLRPASYTTWMQVQEESVKYGDLHVTADIMDGYHNITHSTVALFRAAVALGPQLKYVMKVDDNNYLRVSLILEALQHAPQQWLYAGYPMVPARLPRPPAYWGIPYEEWPKETTFTFGWGGAGYVLSVDLARRIAAGAAHMILRPGRFVHNEDMAIGLCIQALARMHNATVNYKPYHYNNWGCDNTTVAMHLKEPRAAGMRCAHAIGGGCCDKRWQG